MNSWFGSYQDYYIVEYELQKLQAESFSKYIPLEAFVAKSL